MIDRKKADRSIEQLLCLILGKQHAKASEHLDYSNTERIEFCFKMVHSEAQKIVETTEASQLSKAINASRMKLDSLQSLKTLNQLINEVEW